MDGRLDGWISPPSLKRQPLHPQCSSGLKKDRKPVRMWGGRAEREERRSSRGAAEEQQRRRRMQAAVMSASALLLLRGWTVGASESLLFIHHHHHHHHRHMKVLVGVCVCVCVCVCSSSHRSVTRTDQSPQLTQLTRQSRLKPKG